MLTAPWNSSQARRAQAVPAPTLALFLAGRASEIACAAVFMQQLPIWKPLAWWLICALCSTVNARTLSEAQFWGWSEQKQRFVLRLSVCQYGLAVGSAAYFLYLPGDLGWQAVLTCILLAWASVMALWSIRDPKLAVAVVACMIAPATTRLGIEGLVDGRLHALWLGAAGWIGIFSVLFTSHLHARNMARDATLRAQAEQAAQTLAQASIDKARFFASVSHDLRQPVHAIGLYLESLSHWLGRYPDAAAQRAAEGLQHSWRALDDLLSQVLDIARVDAGTLVAHLQPVDVQEAARQVAVQHHAAAEHKAVRLVVSIPENRWVLADQHMLRRVLSNLVDNALKYSPIAGNVMITARPDGGYWRIEVRDAGEGIEGPEQAQIFNEFVQLGNEARDRSQGYGLGLTICQRFAHAMRGQLSLRSRIHMGTTMQLRLPKAHAPTASRARVQTEATSAPVPLLTESNAEHRVLLVEDDALVASGMLELLQDWGYSARWAGSAEQALAMQPWGDLALCDVRLPGQMDGIELALSLRRQGMSVLLLSGETDAPIRVKARTARLVLFAKPCAPSVLRSAIELALVHGDPQRY